MYRLGQAAMVLDIVLPRGAFFREIQIEAAVPYHDGLPVLEFCYRHVAIFRVGSNVKCWDKPTATFEVGGES